MHAVISRMDSTSGGCSFPDRGAAGVEGGCAALSVDWELRGRKGNAE